MRIIKEKKKKLPFVFKVCHEKNPVCCQHLIKRQIYKKRERELDGETDKREESFRSQQVRVGLLQGVVEQLIN